MRHNLAWLWKTAVKWCAEHPGESALIGIVLTVAFFLLPLLYSYISPNDNPQITRQLSELSRQISQEKGVPLKAVRSFLERMDVSVDREDMARVTQLLEKAADDYRKLKEDLQKLTSDEPLVNQYRQKALALLNAGKLGEANSLLQQAKQRDIEAFQRQEESAKKRRLSAAATCALQAGAAKLQINPQGYRQAAVHFAEAADMVRQVDAEAARGYVFQQAVTLYNLGDEFGDNAALNETIAIYTQLLQQIDRTRQADVWAETQSNLGTALRCLGERESGSEYLEQAVAAYREALEEKTRERVPLDWAAIQNNLGNALQTLGERESGSEHLEQAVAAFHEALKERSRERVPLEWAMTQNNLGIALQTLGERESGTEHLEQAVAAFQEALKVFTQESTPYYWTETQKNLAIALQALDERKKPRTAPSEKAPRS